MRVSIPWRRAALAATILLGATAAFATPDPVKLAPGQLTAYKGTAVLVQTQGEEVVNFEFDADALYLTREGTDGSKSVLAARYLKGGTTGMETFGSVDRYKVSGDATLELDPTAMPVFELTPHLHMLNVYLPWEVLPTFAIPGAGQDAASREKISVLNLASVEAGLRTRVVDTGDSLEVTRELAAGEKPGFDFRGNDASVTVYRQKYTIGKTSGRVEALESDCSFGFSVADTKVLLERKVRLKETGTAGIDGANAAEWAGRLEDLPAIEKEFADRKSSEDIAKRVESFSKSASGTPLAALAGALEFRLQAFQQFFEATPTGRVLAGVLGHKAPDFTLKDLDGKDVAFRASTEKNRATLLTFWGYG